jgi:solute:Na+ symporter, SSS family
MGAIFGFAAGLAAMVVATIFSTPKPLSELQGLVFGLQQVDVKTSARVPWFRSPVLWGIGVLALCALLYIYIAVA